MKEPTERERQQQRADELRAEIEERRQHGDASDPPSPREYTDRAADEARKHG